MDKQPIIRNGEVFWRRRDMIFLHALTVAAAILLPLLAILSFMPFSTYLTDLPSHFPLQYLFACLFVGILLFILRLPASWGFLVAFSAALFFMQIYPYWMPGKAETGTATIKVLQANVYTRNEDVSDLRSLIDAENPDVIAIAEPNTAFRKLGEEIKDAYPHQADNGRALLWSKEPLKKAEYGKTTGGLEPLVYHASFHGKPVTLATFHASTPTSPEKRAGRDRQFRDMAEAYRKIAAKKAPEHFIFMGDINATPYCPALKKLSRDLNVRNARTGHGINGSWPVWLPSPLRIPIDHVLVSKDVAVIEHRLGPDIASDHFPTITVLDLR